MSGRIVVVNPNSTQAVTDGMDAALESLRMPGGPVLECVTLAEGPPGIEDQRDADAVIAPLCRYIGQRDNDADAFIVACFSDPGLHSAREVSSKPVLGIAECGVLTALSRGERFGIISILDVSLNRHLRYIRQLGLETRLAGDLAVGLGVVELHDDEQVLARMIATGERLRDECGADVLVMGCAGMARLQQPLENALGLPVVEPVRAAVVMAFDRVCV